MTTKIKSVKKPTQDDERRRFSVRTGRLKADVESGVTWSHVAYRQIASPAPAAGDVDLEPVAEARINPLAVEDCRRLVDAVRVEVPARLIVGSRRPTAEDDCRPSQLGDVDRTSHSGLLSYIHQPHSGQA